MGWGDADLTRQLYLASYLLWLFARVTERLVRFRFLVRFLRVCGVQVDSVICETVIWAVKQLDQSPHWIPDREDWKFCSQYSFVPFPIYCIFPGFQAENGVPMCNQKLIIDDREVQGLESWWLPIHEIALSRWSLRFIVTSSDPPRPHQIS